MSDVFILLSFAFAIVGLVLMIGRFKVHPVFVLFVVVAVLSLMFGQGGAGTVSLINEGFGNTLANVGLLIVFGCVLGKALEISGGALRITQSVEKMLGTKRKMPWGIALASTIIGIPLIADTTVIMLIPIVSAMAYRSKESMMKFGPILYIGAYVMTSLVVPGPGPLAAAGVLGLDFGMSIMYGLLVGLPGIAVATFYLTRIKTYVAPKAEFIESIAKAEQAEQEQREGGSGTTKTLTAQNGGVGRTLALSPFTGLPVRLGFALLPIYLPISLIMIDSLLGPTLPEGSFIQELVGFVGAPIMALAIGVLSTLPLFGGAWRRKEIVNGMFEDGLRTAAMPLALTGVGGALALLIRETGVAERMSEVIQEVGIPPLIVPFLVAAAICTITGSNILGMLTASAIMAPLIDDLGVSALAVYLACGTGAQIFKHANSSGFWVTTTLSNMTVGQGIRSIGVASIISGVTGFAIVLVLYYAGLI
ncbi:MULTISPECIES: GntP family permease [unclassified Pseudoclavibacter]|uniref:GntP family permease n=1 Tax=unclassified Pseudoclavibacter TaxID=2615177 RepID=UPI000CE7445E|nr:MULTISPECIES: SLC13 family permease [unclassified Pseudoclavibacter]MBF4550734.1 GntP family permease [Pseudoclavibacter sp. VKM Ac-2888]PPF77974.1 gluconate transporter [Pseudoclavibacter sp. Z016]PPG05651.1 gluconate transporter [Pseudoclavibacter sp. RFBI5]